MFTLNRVWRPRLKLYTYILLVVKLVALWLVFLPKGYGTTKLVENENLVP